MKKLFIVANWKANKTQSEAAEWMEKVQAVQFTVTEIDNKEIIICPAYPLLTLVSDFISGSEASNKLLIRLGSQNLSQFEKGAYTGEVPINLLQEFCAYCIIGHSERRTNFNEIDDVLSKKVQIANQFNITPIFCVQGKDTVIPKGVTIVAYEPTFAIGTGNPDTPQNAEDVAKSIKEKSGVTYVLYGGSVRSEIVKSFTEKEHLDGVLVGGASLDSEQFTQIIKNT
jgi:triosephosphate isomerase